MIEVQVFEGEGKRCFLPGDLERFGALVTGFYVELYKAGCRCMDPASGKALSRVAAALMSKGRQISTGKIGSGLLDDLLKHMDEIDPILAKYGFSNERKKIPSIRAKCWDAIEIINS